MEWTEGEGGVGYQLQAVVHGDDSKQKWNRHLEVWSGTRGSLKYGLVNIKRHGDQIILVKLRVLSLSIKLVVADFRFQIHVQRDKRAKVARTKWWKLKGEGEVQGGIEGRKESCFEGSPCHNDTLKMRFFKYSAIEHPRLFCLNHVFINLKAEASQMEKDMQNIQQQIDHLHSNVTRLREDENEFTAELSGIVKSINDISKEIAENDRRTKQIKSDIADLQRQQSNTVTAFGGQRVLKLLESIETNHKKFESPPIGPIGAHLGASQRLTLWTTGLGSGGDAFSEQRTPGVDPALNHELSEETNRGGGLPPPCEVVEGGDHPTKRAEQLASESWSVAVDSACGGLLDAFIVTCCKDLHVLRECASKVNFNNLRIIVYDFTRPRLIIPDGSLPTTEHPTVLSVIQSENHTVLNVLVDQGHAERQVLVKDYEVGKSLAFDDRMRNIKEVYTSDGDKIFSRRAVQTFYPPTSKKGRPNRLCSSLGEKIAELKNEAEGIQRTIVEKNGQKSKLVKDQCDLEQKIADSKRKREPEEHRLEKKILELDDAKRAFAEINRYAAVDNSELEEDIKKEKNIIVESEQLLQKIKVKLAAASREVNDRREAYKTFMGMIIYWHVHCEVV
uniref:Structural maintenance of chromosomes protein 6 n=1 Tax=Aegilops tauschii TaxID=37682 RepID=M8B5D1_AEGTA